MEPISSLLSAYLLSLSADISGHYRESVNLDITPIVIEYKNEKISFQHQLWRIKDDSVCATYQQNTIRFSSCTIKAKSLFSDICNELSRLKKPNNTKAQYKRMYCNAAVKYKPMVASISSTSTIKVNANEKACNRLILKAMGSSNKELLAKRDKVCQRIQINDQ